MKRRPPRLTMSSPAMPGSCVVGALPHFQYRVRDSYVCVCVCVCVCVSHSLSRPPEGCTATLTVPSARSICSCPCPCCVTRQGKAAA